MNEWEQLTEKISNELVDDGILPENKLNEFKEWFMERESLGDRLFDRYLIHRCYLICKRLKKKNDEVIVVVGREGIGKTTLSVQLMAMINPQSTIDNICLGSKEVIQSLRQLEKQSCFTIDEGGLSLFSRESMTVMQRSMVKIFMTIRAKELCAIILIPDYKSLDRYIREHRCHLLIDVRGRGKYVCIDEDGIRFINTQIITKKKISSCKIPSDSFFHGWFSKKFPATIKETDYLEKKEQHIDHFLRDMEKLVEEEEGMKDILPKMITAKMFAYQFNMSYKTLIRLIHKGTIPATKLGKKWFIPQKEVDKYIKSCKIVG